MPKHESFHDLPLRPSDSPLQLWRWLYTEIRAAILEGRLGPGARLPSTRSLATQYAVSRGTVIAAFDQLQAEGYTRTEVGSGTYVSAGLPDLSPLPIRHPLPHAGPSRAALSRGTQQLLQDLQVLPASHSLGHAFRAYEPAIDLFPVELWARTASKVLRRAPRALYGQGDAAGYLPLRRAIAGYAGASRGVRCSPEQILITSGAQQGLDLIARFLLDPGDSVWMEDPGYPGARQTLRAAGARIVDVPVDRDGLNVSEARRTAPLARLAYVTPANQFPMGVTLSADRRLELLHWAAEAGAWIVEDEYDAEYRYTGRPVAALHSLDRSGAVIYVGTFTKMLFNALRLGFVVLPERLVAPFAAVRSMTDRHPPTLDQAILAEFISEGHFGHHLRKMRQTYAERLAVLRTEADQHLQGVLEVAGTAAGMRSVGWLTNGMPDREAAERARRSGLETLPLSAYTQEHPVPPGLMLGFAGCSPAEIRRGIVLLAAALKTA